MLLVLPALFFSDISFPESKKKMVFTGKKKQVSESNQHRILLEKEDFNQ